MMNKDDVNWIRWLAAMERRGGHVDWAARLELLADMAQKRADGQERENTPQAQPSLPSSRR